MLKKSIFFRCFRIGRLLPDWGTGCTASPSFVGVFASFAPIQNSKDNCNEDDDNSRR
uniref:Uncharacterized protein n=1 Tax=Anguilla anguilla TaxID=7936 RepID=A0A0E9SUV2_ANGAN